MFKSVSSGKCLDVAAASTADGAAVQQWDCNGTGAQLFHVSSVGGGYVKIVNATSNKALDVTDVSTADGALIQQWTYGGGTNQHTLLASVYAAVARWRTAMLREC